MSQQVKAVGVRAWSTRKKPDVVLCICHPNILIRRWKIERKICPKLTAWRACTMRLSRNKRPCLNKEVAEVQSLRVVF